jgi:hypothetical protein
MPFTGAKPQRADSDKGVPMNDKVPELWAIEERLWLRGADVFAAILDPECLMAFAPPVGILAGERIVASLAGAPRWTRIDMTERMVAQPAADLTVLAYRAEGRRGDADPYRAFCTSTYRRDGAAWRLVQHQQTPA